MVNESKGTKPITKKTDSIDDFWKKQTNYFDLIVRKSAGFGNYISDIRLIHGDMVLDSAFQTDKWVRSTDEGTPGGIRFGGSGILYVVTYGINTLNYKGVSAFDAGVLQAAEVFEKIEGLDGIRSHNHCGAATLVYEKLKGNKNMMKELRRHIEQFNLKGMSLSDALGHFFADSLTFVMNVDGFNVTHMHDSEITRPTDTHVVRFAYYDGTGRFTDQTPFLPDGFVVSRAYAGKEQAMYEISLPAKIAKEHGFGDRIDKDNPFVLVAIGKDREETEKLKMELETMVHHNNSHKSYARDQVIVDGFTAPAYGH